MSCVPVPSVVPRGSNGHVPVLASDPFKGLPIRLTFRTVRVLATVGGRPDASNREIGHDAGVTDQGQMSKLLARLEKAGLIENHGEGQARGEPNAWRLTPRGQGVLHAVGEEWQDDSTHRS
jgi:DNA-binding MarR family transcriptional regulator